MEETQFLRMNLLMKIIEIDDNTVFVISDEIGGQIYFEYYAGGDEPV